MQVFGDTGMLAHRGMQRAALWLFERLSSLLKAGPLSCTYLCCPPAIALLFSLPTGA